MPDCPQRKTLAEFQEKYINAISAKVCPGKTLPRNNPLAILAIVFAALSYMLMGDIYRRFRSLVFTDEMCCDDLIEIAAGEGIIQNQATKATGCVTVTGNVGASIPSDIEFIGSNGFDYILDTSVANPAVIDTNGEAVLCLLSVDPGLDANQIGGSIETSESVPDIDTDAAFVDGGFSGGSDIEDCESIRSRLKERRRRAAVCGNKEWYIDQIRSYPGVTRVCCQSCECSDCGGCCQSGYPVFYPLFDGYADGIPPQSVLDDLRGFIFGANTGDGSGLAPMGAQGDFLAATALDVALVIECACDPSPKESEDIALAVSSWLTQNVCAGGEICYSQLGAIVQNAAPGLCSCNVRVEGADVVNSPADCPATGSIPCGSLPILKQVRFCE